MRYIFYSSVVSVERRTKNVYKSGLGDKAVFEAVDLGYFVQLDGSYESLHIGFNEPRIKSGDKIRVILEKVRNEPNIK